MDSERNDGAGDKPFEPPSSSQEVEVSKRPRNRNRYILYASIVIVVITLLCITVIYLYSSASSGKVVKSTAFDTLLDQNDLPSDWSVSYLPSTNDTYGIPVNGQNGVVSTGWADWSVPNESGNATIGCMLFVLENSNDAHSAIVNWISPSSQSSPSGQLLEGAIKMTTGTIGDESYNFTTLSSDSGWSAVIYREGNTVTILSTGFYPSHGWQKNPYYENLLYTIAQMQCDKIKVSP